MAGIKIYGTKHRATTKILCALSSYLFEQDCDELRMFTAQEREVLKQARDILAKHA